MKKVMMFALIASFGIAVLFAGGVKKAEAFSMKLTDSVTLASVTIADEGPLDTAHGVLGLIGFNGAVGSFTTNITTGTSKPILGSAAFPGLNITTSSLTSAVASTLTIELSDTGFGPSLSPLAFSNVINSSNLTTGTVSYSSFVDLGDTLFAQTILIASLGPASGVFNLSGIGLALTDSSYSVTIVVDITHSSAGQLSNLDATLTAAVPEPGTIALLGIGLAGLVGAGVRRRMKKKNS